MDANQEQIQRMALNEEEKAHIKRAITLLELAIEEADRGRVWIGDETNKVIKERLKLYVEDAPKERPARLNLGESCIKGAHKWEYEGENAERLSIFYCGKCQSRQYRVM